MLCSSDPFFLNDLHSKELSTDCVFDKLDLAKATFAYDAQLVEVFQLVLLCQLFSLLCEVTFKVLQLIGALVCPFNWICLLSYHSWTDLWVFVHRLISSFVQRCLRVNHAQHLLCFDLLVAQFSASPCYLQIWLGCCSQLFSLLVELLCFLSSIKSCRWLLLNLERSCWWIRSIR